MRHNNRQLNLVVNIYPRRNQHGQVPLFDFFAHLVVAKWRDDTRAGFQEVERFRGTLVPQFGNVVAFHELVIDCLREGWLEWLRIISSDCHDFSAIVPVGG